MNLFLGKNESNEDMNREKEEEGRAARKNCEKKHEWIIRCKLEKLKIEKEKRDAEFADRINKFEKEEIKMIHQEARIKSLDEAIAEEEWKIEGLKNELQKYSKQERMMEQNKRNEIELHKAKKKNDEQQLQIKNQYIRLRNEGNKIRLEHFNIEKAKEDLILERGKINKIKENLEKKYNQQQNEIELSKMKINLEKQFLDKRNVERERTVSKETVPKPLETQYFPTNEVRWYNNMGRFPDSD